MIKKLSFCIAVGLAVCTFSTAQAASLDNGAVGGAQIEIDITATCGLPDTTPNFIFKPSPGVVTSGQVDCTGYAFGAGHLSAIGKTDAKAYAMASDSNQVWWMDISTLSTDINDIGGTNSSFLGDYTY